MFGTLRAQGTKGVSQQKAGVLPSGLILGLRPANDRRRYSVTTSFIGWAQASNGPRTVMGLHTKMEDAFITTFCYGTWLPGGRLNKKDGLTRYGDSHVKDKTS